jgi:hypothetical protein
MARLKSRDILFGSYRDQELALVLTGATAKASEEPTQQPRVAPQSLPAKFDGAASRDEYLRALVADAVRHLERHLEPAVIEIIKGVLWEALQDELAGEAC